MNMNDILEKMKETLSDLKMLPEKERNDFLENINVENIKKFKNIVNKYKFFKLNNDELEYYLYHKFTLLKICNFKYPENYLHNIIEELINENIDDSIIEMKEKI